MRPIHAGAGGASTEIPKLFLRNCTAPADHAGAMPMPLVPVQLGPLAALLRLTKCQLARVLHVSPRTLRRYFATGEAPAPIAARPGELARTGLPLGLRERLSTPGSQRAERARLLRIAEAYAVNGLRGQATDAFHAAGVA